MRAPTVRYQHALICFLFFIIAAPQARAGDSSPNFVSRPTGWMILMPPFGRPDHITGEQKILTAAPDKQWTAIVLRGYDGGAYDFADQHRCNLMLTLLGMRLYKDTSEAGLRRLHLLSTAKCVRDDGRRHVLAQ